MSISNYENKEEAKAHLDDMTGFVDFMNGTCECGKLRKDCMCGSDVNVSKEVIE